MRALTLAWALAASTAFAGTDRNPDFDFEFGAWTAHISRLVAPLSGSEEWVEYSGTSVVRPVWNGRANLGELVVSGPSGRIEGMSLRVYDPEREEWRIHWVNARVGHVGEAMVGGFENGFGRFYNEEEFEGRPVLVRFIFSEITDSAFRLEQAFSPDAGQTWEPNWIARFERDGSPAGANPEHEAAGAAWAAIDAAWDARDAERFSGLFADEAVMEFVDRGDTFAGRAAIREQYAQRFATIAPALIHRTTVTRARTVAHGALAVDGRVDVLRTTDEAGAAPELVRRFRVFSLLIFGETDWKFRDMRIFQVPMPAP